MSASIAIIGRGASARTSASSPTNALLTKITENLPVLWADLRRLYRSETRPYRAKLDIQILHIQRIVFDELPPRLNVFAHERGENRLALGNVLELHGQ